MKHTPTADIQKYLSVYNYTILVHTMITLYRSLSLSPGCNTTVMGLHLVPSWHSGLLLILFFLILNSPGCKKSFDGCTYKQRGWMLFDPIDGSPCSDSARLDIPTTTWTAIPCQYFAKWDDSVKHWKGPCGRDLYRRKSVTLRVTRSPKWSRHSVRKKNCGTVFRIHKYTG